MFCLCVPRVFKRIYFLFIYKNVCVGMNAHERRIKRDWKMALDHLELELQVFISCLMRMRGTNLNPLQGQQAPRISELWFLSPFLTFLQMSFFMPQKSIKLHCSTYN